MTSIVRGIRAASPEARGSYEGMVSCMIGAFQALRIMSAEVDQAHDAVVAALATISMTQSGRADDQFTSPGNRVVR